MTSPVRHQWLSGDINSAFCGGKVIRSLQCVLQIQQATNIFHWCIYNSQCFQPILCKNLSSCLYKSWFDWKETLRLQIKNLDTTHKGSANKHRIFLVLISKSCCLSLGVLYIVVLLLATCCILMRGWWGSWMRLEASPWLWGLNVRCGGRPVTGP